MVDLKTIISQVQEFQMILHEVHAEGMILGKTFLWLQLLKVASDVEKIQVLSYVQAKGNEH